MEPIPSPDEQRREREKARELRVSAWWKKRIQDGKCYHCDNTLSPKELTMDHLIPISKGGKSNRGNLVPSCKDCNSEKKYLSPVELILKKIKDEQ